MRTNFPETSRYLQARRSRHPREDAIEGYTEWSLMGNPVDAPENAIPKPGVPSVTKTQAVEKGEETQEQYVQRRCEEYMHKNLSSRRGVGGKFFTIGGGGDGGVAYQVL